MRMNIEAERSRAGLTKTEISKKIDVSLNTYNRYIQGEIIPSDKLVMMADLFQCSTDYLLSRTPQPSV